MVVEVLDGALASDNGLDEETEHGEHGKTAILDLLDLHCSRGFQTPKPTHTSWDLTQLPALHVSEHLALDIGQANDPAEI